MAGRMIAFDQQSVLTPDQKSFLKAIDGKTPDWKLAAQWPGTSDAMEQLQELQNMGLIEVRAARWSNSMGNSVLPADSGHGTNVTVLQTPATQYSATRPAALTPVAATSQTSAELNAIKEHMSTFILTHLPHHAMTVIKEIESISSYDMLRLMLAAYANMVNETGRVGLAHIKSLRAMLEPGFVRTSH